MSKRRLAAMHMHTAREAMFAVTSLRGPMKCPLMPHTSKRTNERTQRLEKIKYIKDKDTVIRFAYTILQYLPNHGQLLGVTNDTYQYCIHNYIIHVILSI